MNRVKLRICLPLLLILANTGCENVSQPKSAYSEAVSDLTNRRVRSLRSVGWSVQRVNHCDGYVLAKKSDSLHPPLANTVVLQNAHISLATKNSVLKNGENVSSVTGCWTGQR